MFNQGEIVYYRSIQSRGNQGEDGMLTDLKKEILLESGTNELEILELGITQDQSFGINVSKVREINAPAKVTRVPRSHAFVEGIIQLRDEVLPVIDLSKVLGLKQLEWNEGIFIVTEFNLMKVVFHVGWVNQICRVSWEQIEEPTGLFRSMENAIVGVIKLQEKMIQLLDFEKILLEISPESGINKERVKKAGTKEARKNKRILVAEDSPLLRSLLEEILDESGYTELHFFENGKVAWDYLTGEKESNAEKQADLLITDIEMPQMDGLHLTKRIKEHPALKSLPVVIFSSLISDALRHKGETVGADAQITKPQIEVLVETIDSLLLWEEK